MSEADRARNLLRLLNTLTTPPEQDDIPQELRVGFSALLGVFRSLSQEDMLDLRKALAKLAWPDSIPAPVLKKSSVISPFTSRTRSLTPVVEDL